METRTTAGGGTTGGAEDTAKRGVTGAAGSGTALRGGWRSLLPTKTEALVGLGLAFYMAWVDCTFHGSQMINIEPLVFPGLALNRAVYLISIVTLCAALLACTLSHGAMDRILYRPSMLRAMPAAMCASTLALLGASLGGATGWTFVAIAGVCTALSSAVCLLHWGSACSAMNLHEIVMVAVVGHVGAAAILERSGDTAAGGTKTDGAAVGRRTAPRRLVPFEVNALNEDVKTMGTQPARLREMLKFFYRGLSELDDRDPAWLITLEERAILDRARAFARETGSAIPCELENLACARLEAGAGMAENLGAPAFAHVLVDGWTSLGAASQSMLAALAKSTLAVAGYADDPGVHAHPYPHTGALTDRNQDRPGETTVVDLGASPRYRAAVETLVGAFPDDEFANVAGWLSDLIRTGRTPGELAVVVPNGVWAHRLANACAERGVPARTLARAPFSGDVRKPDRGGLEAAFTLLALTADGRDALAWRMALGFGDPILSSNRWEALRRWCAPRGLDLVDGLAELEEGCTPGGPEPFDGATRLAEQARCTRADVAQLAGLEGPILLDRACQLARADRDKLTGLLGPVGDCDDARGLSRRLRDQGVDPAFPRLPRETAVRIGCADAFVGVHVPICALCGLVDGFVPGHACFDDRLPPDTKERAFSAERARFERAFAIGTERVALSRFECDWLAEAEPARMEIARIRATQDPRGRVALVRPSAFLDAPHFRTTI